jgi:hypothetical protein
MAGVCEHGDETVGLKKRDFLYQLDNKLCEDAEIFTFICAKQKMLNISVYFHETYKTENIKVSELLFSEKSRPNQCGIMHLNNPKITLAHAYDLSSSVCTLHYNLVIQYRKICHISAILLPHRQVHVLRNVLATAVLFCHSLYP